MTANVTNTKKSRFDEYTEELEMYPPEFEEAFCFDCEQLIEHCICPEEE